MVRVENDPYATERPAVVSDPAPSGMSIIARVVYIITGFIVGILLIRFLLSLLGANRTNGFASFIYDISRPFVAPFFGLFNYNERFGVVRFEFETLVAIVFYIFIGWLIIRLFSLTDRTV